MIKINIPAPKNELFQCIVLTYILYVCLNTFCMYIIYSYCFIHTTLHTNFDLYYFITIQFHQNIDSEIKNSTIEKVSPRRFSSLLQITRIRFVNMSIEILIRLLILLISMCVTSLLYSFIKILIHKLKIAPSKRWVQDASRPYFRLPVIIRTRLRNSFCKYVDRNLKSLTHSPHFNLCYFIAVQFQ